jgi:transcriptional regulator with XRE-family HTH domain
MDKPTEDPDRALVREARELGTLCRSARKRRGLTLGDMYDSTGLSTRFLSEFERGKPHVSLSRVLLALNSLGLDVLVLPREDAERVARELDEASR